MFIGSTKKEDIRDQFTKEEFINFGMIGFDKLSRYKSASVRKAKMVMNELIKKGYAIPFDYGRGKGKYTTTDKAKGMTLREVLTKVYDNGSTKKETAFITVRPYSVKGHKRRKRS